MPGRDAVVCGAHGETRVTFACVHVAEGIACGFHTAPDATAPYPDAWCDACEAVPTVDVVPLCTFCYDAARARNQAALRSSWDALLTAARAHGEALRADLGHARWDFDAEGRTLRLRDPDRVPLIARVRMVGSYSNDTRTFQWSWATYADPRDPAVGEVAFLRRFGEVRGFARLREPNWPATIADGWDMAKIAALLVGGAAIFRATFDHLFWWMLLDDLRVEQ